MLNNNTHTCNKEMDSAMFVNITDVVSREADWPDVGFATGFRNSTMPSLIRCGVVAWSGTTDIDRYTMMNIHCLCQS